MTLRRTALILMVSTWAMLACSPKPSEVAPEANASAPKDPLLVKLSAEQQGQYLLHTVQLRSVADVQSHPGRVEANEQRVSRVGSGVVGRIRVNPT